jgi:GT2 family glycosyltransferase
MQAGSNRIALIVLNYRFPEITLRCLESLGACDSKTFTVFLVDNSPEDGAAEILRSGLAAAGLEHRYIASAENLGFGDGMNQGFRAAIREGFTHVAPLNNDTVAEPGFGRALAHAVERFPNRVLAGLVVDEATGEPSFNIGSFGKWTLTVRHLLTRDASVEPEFVSGCFAVFPVDVLNRIGFYREDYFMYAEDCELSIRLKQAGEIIRFCPDMVLAHSPGSSTDRIGTPKQYYLIRNQTHLVLLWGTPVQKFVYGLYFLAVLANQIRHPKIFRIVYSGLRDAVTGRMGRLST